MISKQERALWIALALGAPVLALAAPVPQTMGCIDCHRAEAEPLARSRHGLASSPGLWGQLPTQGPHVGQSLSCLLCHAPASDQQPWQATGAKPEPAPGVTALEAEVTALAGAEVAPNPAHDPHATELGVSCTACHLQGSAIVGAPHAGARRKAPHPVTFDPSLADAERCATCHQFSPASAVAGKPLENTYVEWKASRWAQAGATCQSCHMPFGRHLFQGIHTPALVRSSVEVRWERSGPRAGRLVLANTAVGHDFPTYVTPRVILTVQPEDAKGAPVGAPARAALGRVVESVDGRWREVSDTRVPPGEERALTYAFRALPGAVQLHATIRVEPDWGYVSLYQRLLTQKGLPAARYELLRSALSRAQDSSYILFAEYRKLGAVPSVEGAVRPR